jgi:hypothetical protein
MENSTNQPFEQWCILELMGRQQIAGKVTERVIAGQGFLEILVPETDANPSFTRFVAPGSLYAINPVTEEVARMKAKNLQVQPIESWDIRRFMEKVEEQKQMRLAQDARPVRDNEEEEYNEHDDGDL